MSTRPAQTRANGPTDLLDLILVLLGSWWLYSMVMVYGHQSFDTLMRGLWLPLVGGAALWWWMRRETLEPPCQPPAPVDGLDPAHQRNAAVVCTAALLAWWGLGLPYLLAWSVLAATALWLWRQGPAPAPPAPLRMSARDTWSLPLACVAALVLVSGFHRPEVDDAYHINAILSVLEYPELPVLSFDNLHGDRNAPLQQLIHRPQTWEVLVGALSIVTGAEHRALYWLWLPAGMAVLTTLSVWRLFKAMAPDSAWLGVWLVFVIWLAWGEDYRTYGSYSFTRLFQGKPVFICMIVPAIIYQAARFNSIATPRRYFMFMLTLCSAAPFTSSALLLAPVVAGIGLLGSMAPTRQGLARATVGLSATAPLLLVLLLVKLELSGVGGLRHDGWMRDMSAVVGETIRAPMAIGALLAVPLLAQHLRHPSAGWMTQLCLASLVVVFNGEVAGILARHAAELFSWRLYWTVPLPFFLALAITLGLSAAWRLPSRRNIAGFAAVSLALGTFWAVDEKSYDRPAVSWQWWELELPARDQRAALEVLEITEPTHLVLADKRVAERITGLAGRPRLVSVRESYLTNLSRYWGDAEFQDRLAMMKLASESIPRTEMAIGLEAIQAWCVDTVVLRRRVIHEPFMLHRRLLEAGYEPARTLRRHTVYQLNTPCTPTRP